MKVKQRVARKNYPAQDIKRGDVYYSWAHYRGPKQRSRTPPTRSQLTTSEARQTVYGAYDQSPLPTAGDDVSSMADQLDEAAQMFSDQLENLPEGFQQAVSDNADACTAAAEELRDVASAIEDGGDGDYYAEDGTLDADAVRQAISDTEPDLQQ